MSVPREVTLARSRLKTTLRATARLLGRLQYDPDENPDGLTEDELTKAIDQMLGRIGPTDGDVDQLEEVMRRGAFVIADGYPTSSLGQGVSGGGAETATATERAALRLASPAVDEGETGKPDEWQEERDLVGDALRELVLNVDLTHRHMRDNDDICRLIFSVEKRMHGRPVDLGECDCCGRVVLKTPEDPMESGYCVECFAAWVAAGRPERIEFNRTRVVCTECGRSTDDWEVLDKRNYHRRGTGPGCYWKAYNRTRGRRATRGA